MGACCCCCLSTTVPPVTGPQIPVGSLPYRFPQGAFCRFFYPGVKEQTGEGLRKVREFGYNTGSTGKYQYTRAEVVDGLSRWAGTPECLLTNSLGRNKVKHFEWALNPIKGKSPLVVFSHGLGGNADIYSKFCAELASLGYIVIAIEHEDGSGSFARDKTTGEAIFYKEPPEGFVYNRETITEFREPFLEIRKDEIIQILRYLKGNSFDTEPVIVQNILGNIDLERCLISGHSFGGATVAKVIHDFEHVKEYNEFKGLFEAAVLLDIWSYSLKQDIVDGGLSIPTISFLSDEFHENNEYSVTQDLLRNSDTKLAGYVKETTHTQYSDGPWFSGLRFIRRRGDFEGEQDSNEFYAALMEATGLFLAGPEDFSIKQLSKGLILEHELIMNI